MRSLTFILLAVSSVFMACHKEGGSLSNTPLLGSWQQTRQLTAWGTIDINPGSRDTLQFSADGTLTWIKPGLAALKGRYTVSPSQVQNGLTLQVSLPPGAGSQVSQYTVVANGSQLNFLMAPGTTDPSSLQYDKLP